MTTKADGGSSGVNQAGTVKLDNLASWNEFQKELEEQQKMILARERKNPAWKRFSDRYIKECKDRLLSDGWTLKDAAYLLAGYAPGRPDFGDKGAQAINAILRHLGNSVGSSLHPSKKRLIRGDLFPSKDLIRWALGKNLSIHEELEVQIRSVITKPVQGTVKKKRKDTVQREQAQDMAVEYWNSELVRIGKRRSYSEVIRYLIKNLEYLDIGDEEKVRRWIKPVCPWKDELRDKYGNQG